MVSKVPQRQPETCVCANRLYAQEASASPAKRWPTGAGHQVGSSRGRHPPGPADRAQAMAKVESHVADALAKGAKLVVGGKRIGDRFYAHGAGR